MMLNSYVPNRLKRYVFAGSALTLVGSVAFFASDSYAGVSSVQTVISAPINPILLALCAAPSMVALLFAALSFKQSRLSRQLDEERETARKLRHAAYHDSLTGLRNRHALSEDLGKLRAARESKGEGFALLLFDLDRFKFINDTLGHAAGDEVLKVLTHRITAACGEGQRVYRLGGDEFVVLWKKPPAKAEIARFCESLSSLVFQPVEFGNGSIDTSGSIGIAIAGGDANTLSVLLKRADLALYRAKETPGCSHRFFSEDMDFDYRLRRNLEADMRDSLNSGDFKVQYSPVFEAGSLRPKGFATKLQWKHPVHGAVAPKVFMPMAEESGLIVMIGKWMLEQALKDAAHWNDETDLIIPVTLMQLSDPSFASDVTAAMVKTGFNPKRLVCDIQATSVPATNRTAMAAIDCLRKLGVKLAVSDFTAGISGLAMTRSHPVDLVRLDLKHVKAIAGEERFAQMLSLFLQLASTVGTPVALTGVDTLADLECAITAGALDIEGAFAGPVLSAGDVQALFQSGDKQIAPIARIAG